jgi:serine/threonine protein kinase
MHRGRDVDRQSALRWAPPGHRHVQCCQRGHLPRASAGLEFARCCAPLRDFARGCVCHMLSLSLPQDAPLPQLPNPKNPNSTPKTLNLKPPYLSRYVRQVASLLSVSLLSSLAALSLNPSPPLPLLYKKSKSAKPEPYARNSAQSLSEKGRSFVLECLRREPHLRPRARRLLTHGCAPNVPLTLCQV